MEYIILGLALLFFTGHALRGVFTRTKVPDLLIITLLGYIIGPVLGVVNPEDFGEIGNILSTMALIVILYEGGIHLRAKDLVSSSWPTLKITITGFVTVIIAITAVGIMFALKDPTTAFLLALALSSTASAVVIPLVRTLSVSDSTKTVLSLESAITDILTIVLFLVAVDGLATGQVDPKSILIAVGPKTMLAILAGFLFAISWSVIKSIFSNILPKAFAGEAFALLVYGVTGTMELNGALAVLAYGFTLGNLNLLPIKNAELIVSDLKNEYDMALLKEVSNILRTFFFLYLGVLIKLNDWKVVAIAILITTAIYATRYLAVMIMFKAKDLTRMEAMTMTAMGPRGLAAAVLATLPVQLEIAGGLWVQEVCFAVILMTIVVTAVLVILIERDSTRKVFSKLYLKFPEQGDLVDSNQRT